MTLVHKNMLIDFSHHVCHRQAKSYLQSTDW